MALTTCSVDTDNITNLDDLPNDVGGLTASQLKALFDKFGIDLVAWFNATHINELDTAFAVEASETVKGKVELATTAETTTGTDDTRAVTPAGLKESHVDSKNPHPNTPSVRVYNSGAQSIANATWTALAFDSERFDTDTIHDAAANTKLTCKTAGKYLIVGNMDFATNNTGSRTATIKLNGTTYIALAKMASVPGTDTPFSISTIYDLAVNDYVEIHVYQDCGGPLNSQAIGNYVPEFMMVRVA